METRCFRGLQNRLRLAVEGSPPGMAFESIWSAVYLVDQTVIHHGAADLLK